MRNQIQLLTRSALWAIRPEAVSEAILSLSVEAPTRSAPKPIQGGADKIAVIPIQGVLTKDGPAWYGTNYDTIGKAVEDAAANPDVKHIVLAVDSPGGEVTGLPETAALIAEAAKVKPVTAMVDGMSASAAYWLASQANSIVLTPSGEVGSVGVRTMHVDVTKMMEDQGYKVTELSSGDFKTEWSPYKPVSEEAKADMLTRLQATHREFVDAVATGRGSRATREMRAARFGEGRMFSSSAAMTHGLVDRVQSSRAFFKTIASAGSPSLLRALHDRQVHLVQAGLK
jgi:signal peptide peptidase SppA